MKFLLVFAVIGCYSINYSQKVIAPLEKITLYLDGAKVTRKANLNLKKGEQTIVIQKLSNKLDDNSVRLNTSSEAKILSITTRQNFILPKVGGNNNAQLHDSIKLKEIENKDILDELEAYKTEKEIILVNQKVNGSSDFSPSKLEEYANFYRDRILKLNRKISALNRAYDKNSELITKYQNHIRVNSNTTKKAEKEIVLVVKAKKAMTANFEIEYIVNSAGWSPTYDIRVKDITEPMKLDYKAQVYNNTGVNWKNVQFVLSTADPRKSASKPDMTPWVISNNRYQRNYDQVYQQNSGANTNKKTIQNDGITYEEINIPELTVEFDIEDDYNIPSDARPYLIDVTSYELNASYKHFAVPKIEKAAFLLARITGWEDLNLIEANANVYFGGNYIGKSYINTEMVQDTLDVSLGRDNKVAIDRIKVKDYQDTKVIGNNKKDILEFEISVKNLRTQPIQIEIMDQVPISGDDEIVIEAKEISNAEHDDKTGRLTWKYNISPAATEKIDLAFSIKYPRHMSYAKQKSVRRVKASF